MNHIVKFNYYRVDASDPQAVRVIDSGPKKQEWSIYATSFSDVFRYPPDYSELISLDLYASFKVARKVVASAVMMQFVVPINGKDAEAARMFLSKEDDSHRRDGLELLKEYIDPKKLPGSPLAVVVRLGDIPIELDGAFGHAAVAYFGV